MITKNHIIELNDTSASEMARFRQIMLGIWRQQIEDDKNATEMEKFTKECYEKNVAPDNKYTTNWLGEVVLNNDISVLNYKSNLKNIYDVNEELNLKGHFYTKEGKYLGRINLGDNVYITEEATFLEIEKGKTVSNDKIIYFTEKYKLTNTQLLDRAHWIFGEGRGEFATEYAHTIENIKKWGYHGNGFSEEGTYASMSDNKYKGKTEFFSGKTGYGNYDDFSKARIYLNAINKLKNANIVIKAIFDQQRAITTDPTPNATQWLGKINYLSKKEIEKGKKLTAADKSYNFQVKKLGKDKVLRKDGKSKYSHLFLDTRLQADIDKLNKKKS